MDREARRSLELARAAQAERLMSDTMLQEAISAVREQYEKAWRDSKPDDADKREHAYHALKAVDEVLRKLEKHIETGKLAKRDVPKKRVN